jgi:outer membrane receptor protein involved in Fe transport
LRNTSFRALLGVKGEVSDGFTYDVTGSYAHVESKQVYLHDFSVSRLTKALNVVTDPSTGKAVCASVLDGTDTACVPYNVFTIGGITSDALNYVQIPLLQTGSTTQISLTANFGADLTKYGFVSPFAKSGVQLAFGAEYRQDSLESVTDTSFATGDGAGQGGPTIGLNGATHVAEGYLEANIPIVEDAAFAKSISADLSYRFSSYDRIDTNSYGAQLQWSVNDDIRLRGSYERAVRAPNVIEQYKANGMNLDSSFTTDPCGKGGYATLTACQSTPGAGSAAWYGSGSLNSPAGQYNVFQGGTPTLHAEKADTFTVGFVLTPQAISGLVVSADFFDVKMRNSIEAFNGVDILAACYKYGVATECAKIHRTALGLLWTGTGYIEDRNVNIGGKRTSGVDFNASYQFGLGDLGLGLGDAGSASVNLTGTWQNKLTTNTGLGTEYACTGEYGSSCGTPSPAWRHVLRTTWEAPWYDLSVTASWRFFGGVKQLDAATTAIDYRWPSRSYFDLSAAAPIFTGTSLRVGVNNLFDNDPPLSSVVGTTGNGNTYPQVYDSMGRYLFASLTVDL